MKKYKDNALKINLFGYSSKLDLYNELLKKSIFVFPEYETRARKGICKHTVDFITSDVYSGGHFVTFSARSNARVFYHLKKLAEKGFVSRANGKRRGKIKFNMLKIKTGWLDLDHKKTEEEFKIEAIKRIQTSVKDIECKARELADRTDVLAVLSDIASNLEILIDDIENSDYGHGENADNNGN